MGGSRPAVLRLERVQDKVVVRWMRGHEGKRTTTRRRGKVSTREAT